ncbi:MAG TPA: lipopolysaccharide transport periplasmic protein LptA [Rhizomicrobium sp.]|jgi:lipopolysaccharide export system protein LptA
MKFGAVLTTTLTIATAATAYAETTTNLGKHDTNAPIQVSADQFNADMNAKSGVYTGNVIVTQGDFNLRSNTVRIHVIGSKPDKIFANGSVVFTSSTQGTATGDAAVYDVAPRLITFTGRVVLTKEKNVMRGTSLRVNLATGQATLNAAGSTQSKGRVQGIFTPPPQSNGADTPNTPTSTNP